MLLIALVWASTKGAPATVQFLLAALLVGFMVLYGVSYVAFGKKDPNLLRSEKFNIEKLAIERGVYGDSAKGIIDVAFNDKKLPAVAPDTADKPE